MKEQLFNLIFYFETGAKTEFDIIQWAMNQVICGNTSDSINNLAGLLRNEEEKVRDLFKKAIEEMGYQYPSKHAFGCYRAKLISENIINGKILPQKGCSVIGRICSELEWPKILEEFGLLSHQLSGHEELGITEDGLKQEIIYTAKKFIDNVNRELNFE